MSNPPYSYSKKSSLYQPIYSLLENKQVVFDIAERATEQEKKVAHTWLRNKLEFTS